MATILVTGATGTLGVPTVRRLRALGHTVRALSRSGVDGGTAVDGGTVRGDLVSGDGIAQAVSGVDAIVHLATTGGKHDIPAVENLLGHAATARVRHFVLISIVGVDRIAFGYYQTKLAIERIVTDSPVPHTILRATQFHPFVDRLFRAQRFSPVLFTPDFSVQPIAVEDVAQRLGEIVGSRASGRVPDIAGPQQRTGRALAGAWKRAYGSRRRIVSLWLPGATFAGFAAGHNLVPGAGYGRGTFEGYLRQSYWGPTLTTGPVEQVGTQESDDGDPETQASQEQTAEGRGRHRDPEL